MCTGSGCSGRRCAPTSRGRPNDLDAHMQAVDDVFVADAYPRQFIAP
jgi:hypothetical protein